MSSPMFDIPEHFIIPVNADGNGPETDISKISAWLCWCGRPHDTADFRHS